MYNKDSRSPGAEEGSKGIFLLFPPSKTHFCLKFREKKWPINVLNGIVSNALPIEVVLKAIYNQSTTMAEAGLVPKKVQKGFSCCFPLQKPIFASNSERKSDLQMCWMALRVMRYPLKRFLWQYIINVHQYLPLVWCQRRSKINFPVVSSFKIPFLPQIQREKVIYKMGWITLRES